MNEPDLQHFKEQLTRIAAEIEAALRQEDPTKESITPDNAIGRLTRMEAIQAQSMSQEGRRRQQSRLQKIERALERIEKGSYGTCVKCGEEIPKGRLEIMPESALCVKCAARR